MKVTSITRCLAVLVSLLVYPLLAVAPLRAAPALAALNVRLSDLPPGSQADADQTFDAAGFAAATGFPPATYVKYGLVQVNVRSFVLDPSTDASAQLFVLQSAPAARKFYTLTVEQAPKVMSSSLKLKPLQLGAVGDERFGFTGAETAAGKTDRIAGAIVQRGIYLLFLSVGPLSTRVPASLVISLAKVVDSRIQHPVAADTTPIPSTATPTRHPLTDPNSLHPLQHPLAVGTVAPDFDLAAADGQREHLADARGHVVLLDFFAVWCDHCQREAPIVDRLVTAYGPKGLRVLDILASPYGKDYGTTGDTRLADRGDIDWYARTFHLHRPILIDPHFATVNRYGAYSYPTIYVLDARGVIRYAAVGEQPYQTLAAAVRAAGAP